MRLGLSRRELARTMRRSPSWVREIEHGQQFAPPYLTKALADALGVSIAWLYGEPDLPRILSRALGAGEAATGE